MTILQIPPLAWYASAGRITAHGVPEGHDGAVIGTAARALADQDRAVLHVARDDARLAAVLDALACFAPDVEIFAIPAWDCLPYDRVSPNGEIVSRRLDALTRLAAPKLAGKPRVVVTTVAGVLQRVPARALIAGAAKRARIGDRLPLEELLKLLERTGYRRSDTVREPGEYAVRGGIVDVFPAGVTEPLRLDFFGDVLDGVREFDPETQRTTAKRDGVEFKPTSEVMFDETSIARFRAGYRKLFGTEQASDTLYEAISAGRHHPGMEHWLPLFHEQMDTLLDYVPGAAVTLDGQAEEAISARLEQIKEFYDARRSMMGAPTRDGAPYNPLPPDRLYLTGEQWVAAMDRRPVATFSSSPAPEGPGRVDFGARLGRDFGDVRARPDVNLFEAVRDHVNASVKAGRRVLIAGQSAGSRDRLRNLLRERGLTQTESLDSPPTSPEQMKSKVAFITLRLERGFETPGVAVIAEGDILGDRLIRAVKKKRNNNFLNEVANLNEGDLVVHVDHGIGRYDGLITLDIGGAPHDCLRVLYAGGDKLFVPVENIDVLSRFGSEEVGVQLDKLGGVAWQNRKARVRQRIREIADKLIKIAAEREVRAGEPLEVPDGVYDEFAAHFPYAETEDQLKAIEDALTDLASGRPMDRLVCGDVGFGKTEVAIRAAFVAAMSGTQVAVVVPTTLLARQHFMQFERRFKGLPVRVEQLSRLVPAKRATQIKKDIALGQVDIIVGTHAVLAKSIEFKNIGLLIIDEEQHFGVGQKERLKELKSNVHVLTLTATPIPRTLQLALSGVRDMSIIATPPVDRLAVRTFVMPYDGLIIREAIMRERFRGGQVFYVCPRIEDLDRLTEDVRRLVPEAKIAVAHGRLAPSQLEDVMTAFVEGRFDILISTNIVESGLDIPTANTMIIHRADMFGLAQLYQLRGRIGRSKTRAYCYLTLPPDRVLSVAAQKRLDVMQTLDQLGAGFQLASHDMDIRGAGNLLGEEQSGHVREVGIELYQHLLEEAVAAARSGAREGGGAEGWSPTITVGTPVLIPESYVADLSVRLSLYRRVSNLVDRAEIDGFAAEMIDRFGPLPAEVENLLQIIQIKRLCREAGVEKIDAGPKGAVMQFHQNNFRNPPALVDFIRAQSGTVKLRPDHKLVFMRGWDLPEDRIAGVHRLIQELARLAA